MTEKMPERTARYIVVCVEGLHHVTTHWGDPLMRGIERNPDECDVYCKPPRTLTRFQAIQGLKRARKAFPENKYKILAFYYTAEEGL